MSCIFCYSGEQTAIVCSSCVQKLIRLPPEKLKEAYILACERGYSDKVNWLEQLLTPTEEVILYGDTTAKPKRDMDRKRAVRKTRAAR